MRRLAEAAFEKVLKCLFSTQQSLMVDESILKLEIKRLRETLSSKADNVLSLEQRKLQLETVSTCRLLIITVTVTRTVTVKLAITATFTVAVAVKRTRIKP